MSLPDIALLQPVADTLGVTVTELLAGEYIRKDQTLNISVAEPIVRKSFYLTARGKWIRADAAIFTILFDIVGHIAHSEESCRRDWR